MDKQQETKEDNLNKVSVNPILLEIEKAFTEAPRYGEVTISLVFRDSKLCRWLLTRVESRQIG